MARVLPLILCLIAATARAGELPAYELGDRYFGIVSVPVGQDQVVFAGLGGERVRARVKVDKGESLQPVLELVQLSSGDVLASAVGNGRVARLPSTSLPADGSYVLRVAGAADGTGRFELRTASRLSPELAKLVVDPSDAAPLVIPFAAKAGGRLRARIGPDKGAEARAVAAELIGPDGPVNLFGAVSTKGKSLRVSVDELPLTGDYALRITPDGAPGSLAGRLKLTARKLPPTAVFKAGLLPQLGFAVADSMVGEGSGQSGHAVDVRLSLPFGGAATQPVSVTVSLDEVATTAALDVDFEPLPPQVVDFPAGSVDGALRSVEVRTRQDGDYDPGELIALRLSDPTAGAQLIEPTQHMVTIVDDESPPDPEIVSFSVDDTEPLLGDSVTFEWQLLHVDQPGLRLELQSTNGLWPTYVFEDPAASGSQAVPITNAIGTTARLRLYRDGNTQDTATLFLSPEGLAVFLKKPGFGANPSELVVSADVVSDFELESLTATVGSQTTDLVLGAVPLAGAAFSGLLDLSGLPQGLPYTVEVQAVDFAGAVATVERTFLLDDPPILDVIQPPGGSAWALPELPVLVTCEDLADASCQLTVTVGGQTLLSGLDAFDEVLDLTPWDGQEVLVWFWAEDDQGQKTGWAVDVHVEASPQLEQLAVVPGRPVVLDADPTRVLHAEDDDNAAPLSILDVTSGESTLIYPAGMGKHFGQARLTPSGAALVRLNGGWFLYAWDTAQQTLEQVALLTQSDWAVEGDLVLVEQDPNPAIFAHKLAVFDLATGERTFVSTNNQASPENGLDLDAAGNVAFTDTNGQVHSVIDGVKTQHTMPSTDWHSLPRIEGTRVLWRETPCCSLPDEAVKLWDDGVESFLAPWEPWIWFPTYDVAGDWIAYTRAGSAFQNGNLWIRDPVGVDWEITGSSEQVTLLALSPEGEAMVRIGQQLWLATTSELRQLTFGNGLGYDVRWTADGWRLWREDAVFRLAD